MDDSPNIEKIFDKQIRLLTSIYKSQIEDLKISNQEQILLLRQIYEERIKYQEGASHF